MAPDAGDAIPTRTLPVRVVCNCPGGRKPPIRTNRAVRGRSSYDPDEIILTWRCHKCGTIVALTAKDLHLSKN